MLLQRLAEMQSALVTLKENSYKQKGEEMMERMAKMKPLRIPRRTTISDTDTKEGEEKQDKSKDESEILDLMRRANHLKSAINNNLVSASSVTVDLKKKTCSQDAACSLLSRRSRQTRLAEEASRLQLEVARLKASRVPGGEVSADLCNFPSPLFGRAVNESEYTVVGKVRLPVMMQTGGGDSGYGATAGTRVPLIVGLGDLQHIHQTVMG
jgi:hypothetical protein